MDYNEIAAVSGKSGLFKVLKPTRNGVILESLDEKKSKLVTGPHHRVSLLSEISVYTMDVNKNIPLEDVFKKIYKEFGDDPGLDGKSDKDELFAFMKEIVPDFDSERVYPSDIKKIVSWYKVVYDKATELLKEKEQKKKDKSETQDPAKEKKEDKPPSEENE